MIKKFILLFLLLHWFFYPQYSFLNWEEDRFDFYTIQENYEWLDRDVYFYIIQNSNKYKIDVRFICSLIQAESGGKNIRARRINNNGTYDHGYMQINEVHLPIDSDVRVLYNPAVNIEIGIRYLSRCLDRAKGDKSQAVRMYNQGINGSVNRYENWQYVSGVLNNYIASL